MSLLHLKQELFYLLIIVMYINLIRKYRLIFFFFIYISTCFQLMRWIISEICALWKICNEKALSNGTSTLFWGPWEHIYPFTKTTKGHMPLYNSYGKYVVKLYWMVSTYLQPSINFMHLAA